MLNPVDVLNGELMMIFDKISDLKKRNRDDFQILVLAHELALGLKSDPRYAKEDQRSVIYPLVRDLTEVSNTRIDNFRTLYLAKEDYPELYQKCTNREISLEMALRINRGRNTPTKVCPECGDEKSILEFPWDKRTCDNCTKTKIDPLAPTDIYPKKRGKKKLSSGDGIFERINTLSKEFESRRDIPSGNFQIAKEIISSWSRRLRQPYEDLQYIWPSLTVAEQRYIRSSFLNLIKLYTSTIEMMTIKEDI